MKVSTTKICIVAFTLVMMTFTHMSLVLGDDRSQEYKGDHQDLEEEEEEEEEVVAEEEESIIRDPLTTSITREVNADYDNEDDVPEDNIDECSRISPKEIFHTEIHPRLLNILDELSHFVESVLSRIESALLILIPHVQESPIGVIKVEDLFPEVRQFVYGTMKDVYDLIRVSWRDFIWTHIHQSRRGGGEGGGEGGGGGDVFDAHLLLEALKVVKDCQIQGEEKIKASLMELSITIKAIVLNSIYVIQDTLKLPEDAKGEEAIHIARSLPKIAPNFLGTLMLKIMEMGQDKNAYEKIMTNTLRSLTQPVDQMYEKLESIVEAGSDPNALQEYWKMAINECHARLKKDPLLESDFEVVYQNEEYLTSLVLGLIASF